MSSDVLANFSCLDELTQVIYQNADRFVVLSAVSDEWTVLVGLAGPEGRWWRGSWGKDEILQIVGSKSSDKLLETFAEKLAETFVQGELYIGDWGSEKGAKIKLTFGSSSKKPLHIPLDELNSTEAAAHATNVFLDIALQAQSRQCRLHPPQYPISAVTLPTYTRPEAESFRVIAPIATHVQPGQRAETSSTEITAQAEIKALKAELDREKQRMKSPAGSAAKSSTAPRPLKGASLANPTKKARKYQAIEFESDEE